MKFMKDNAYIFVGALLAFSLVVIIINSIHAGYQQYKLEGEPHMYGLMYVSPEGEKEYYTNTDYGHVSKDIRDIAELVQKKTAETKAKQLLKAGHLEESGGEIYVIEIVKLAINPEKVTIPKKKAGYIIQSTNSHDFKTCYYRGPMNREWYRSYDYSECLTPATRFKTEKKALEAIGRFVKDIREHEAAELAEQERYHKGRPYSSKFPTIVERNDFIIENLKAVKVEEDK